MKHTDPKTFRVDRPVPVTASSSQDPLTADQLGFGENGTEMAAPRLDGPQHAPSLTKTGSQRVRMEAWRADSPVRRIGLPEPTAMA